jgi:putative membrane protein
VSPPPSRESRARDHLANERTLLAWIRTALTVIGLGFIVGRLLVTGGEQSGWASALGAFLVLAGGASAVVGLWRYLSVERQIERGQYAAQAALHVVVTGFVALAALLLLTYLLLVPPGEIIGS